MGVSREGSYVLTASDYAHGTIKLWDITTCQCLMTFHGYAPLSISQDGRYALSATKDGHLALWAVFCDAETVGAPFLRCRPQQDVVAD